MVRSVGVLGARGRLRYLGGENVDRTGAVRDTSTARKQNRPSAQKVGCLYNDRTKHKHTIFV